MHHQLLSFFIIMKLIEGYYKAVGCYYQILKVNNQQDIKMLYKGNKFTGGWREQLCGHNFYRGRIPSDLWIWRLWLGYFVYFNSWYITDVGEAYGDIKELTGVHNYNIQFKWVWIESMGEGFKDMVCLQHLSIILDPIF